MPPPVPRIARVIPKGPITRPGEQIPVIARLRWASGEDRDVTAVAIGWTRDAVEIRWDVHGDLEFRNDWIAAADVRRTTAERAPDQSRPPDARGHFTKHGR